MAVARHTILNWRLRSQGVQLRVEATWVASSMYRARQLIVLNLLKITTFIKYRHKLVRLILLQCLIRALRLVVELGPSFHRLWIKNSVAFQILHLVNRWYPAILDLTSLDAVLHLLLVLIFLFVVVEWVVALFVRIALDVHVLVVTWIVLNALIVKRHVFLLELFLLDVRLIDRWRIQTRFILLLTNLLLIGLIALLDTFEAHRTTMRLWIQASWWVVWERFCVFIQMSLRLRLSSCHILVRVDFVWKLVNLRRLVLFFVRCLAWCRITIRSLCIHSLSWSIGWLRSTALASRPICIEISVQVCQLVVSWRQKWNKVLIFFINFFDLRLLRHNLPSIIDSFQGLIGLNLSGAWSLAWCSSISWRYRWCLRLRIWIVSATTCTIRLGAHLLVILSDILNLLWTSAIFAKIYGRYFLLIFSSSDSYVLKFLSRLLITAFTWDLERHISFKLLEHHSFDVIDLSLLILLDFQHFFLQFIIKRCKKALIIFCLLSEIILEFLDIALKPLDPLGQSFDLVIFSCHA